MISDRSCEWCPLGVEYRSCYEYEEYDVGCKADYGFNKPDFAEFCGKDNCTLFADCSTYEMPDCLLSCTEKIKRWRKMESDDPDARRYTEATNDQQ